MLSTILIALVVLIAALLLYIRLAPTDAGRWHKVPQVKDPEDRLEEGGFLAARRLTAGADAAVSAIAEAAKATPRTRPVAGSVDAGMINYETRSRLCGFPDYTTVAVSDDLLIIYGRLRFGRSDLGVNRARIQGWLRAVADLTEPL